MKLSELKPCDNCNGEKGKLPPTFFTLRVTRYLFDAKAANTTLALTSMFGGSLTVAEVMTPTPDVEHEIATKEFVLCQACFIEGGASMLARLYFSEEGSDDDAI